MCVVCLRYGAGPDRDGSAGDGSSAGSGSSSGPEQHLTAALHTHQCGHVQGHDPTGTARSSGTCALNLYYKIFI